MGQKEKARAIVQENLEFQTTTSLGVEGILAAAQRAAEGSRTVSGAGFREDKAQKTGEGAFSAVYRFKGPGGLGTAMVTVISGHPADKGKTAVALAVGDFWFKKGSLGMKPTIPRLKSMVKFVQAFKTELAAG